MNIIVAVDSNWGIGYNGTQPVVLPEDRGFFRKITSGGTVIVGRRTLADFPAGRPLKNRRNIIMSTDPDFTVEGAEVAHSVEEAIALTAVGRSNRVFVIGGARVYEQFLPYCERAFVTRIRGEYDADSFFENLDLSPNWELQKKGAPRFHDGVEYSFDVYRNKAPIRFT